MEKYNNGKPLEIPKKEEEKALAISEWSEGNKHLADAISACINNGIQTFASCKGHGLLSAPYLSMEMTSKNLGQIINIIDTVYKKRAVNITLFYDENNQGSILTIYPSLRNRNKIFNLIANSAQKTLEFEKANEVVQEVIRLHETLRIYGLKNDRMTNIIDVRKGVINKNIKLIHSEGSNDYLLNNELAKTNSEKGKWGYYNLGKKQLKNLNRNLISTFTKLEVPIVEEDEFVSVSQQDKVRQEIKEKTLSSKRNLEHLKVSTTEEQIITDISQEIKQEKEIEER